MRERDTERERETDRQTESKMKSMHECIIYISNTSYSQILRI